MTRLTKLLSAALLATASGIQQDALEKWLFSSSGLDMPSKSDAEAAAAREYKPLSYARASVDSLSKLKSVLFSSSALDLSKQEMLANFFPLAHARVNADQLKETWTGLFSSSGADMQKAQAQQATIKLGVQRASAKNLKDLWRVLFSISGINLSKSEAQRWIVDLVSAGGDANLLSTAFKQYYRTQPKDQAAKNAIMDAVEFNMGGVPRRFAKDGKLYNAGGFKGYYGDLWLNEWLAAPEERRNANDGVAYSVSEFETYYGDSWQTKWSASPVTEQKRLAEDGKIYTVGEFLSYYHDQWQQKWFQAVDIADDCAFANHDACDALKGKCIWKWTGDWTNSCVSGTSEELVV